MPELIAIALTRRPELGERQAAIRAALLELRNAKLLPFSPNVIIGYSAGDFGGGSNLVQAGILQPNGTVLQQSRFGNYADRQDFDATVYWSLRNLGLGNIGLVRLAQSNLRQNEWRNMEVLDRVRAEVAIAYGNTHTRYAQIETNERATKSSMRAFEEDIVRTKNREGLPIEVLDSLRLLARSRYAYLDAIIGYNRAHFELYVALGQPPVDVLAPPRSRQPGARPMKNRQWARQAVILACFTACFLVAPPFIKSGEGTSPLGLYFAEAAHSQPTQIIDLKEVLRLTGLENPTIGLAEEITRADLAELTLARSLLFPSLNLGTTLSLHQGNLLSAQGIIRNVDRDSLYFGAGADVRVPAPSPFRASSW